MPEPLRRYLVEAVAHGQVWADLVRAQLGDASPAWVPDWVDDRVFDRAFAGIQRFFDEVGADPRHELRRAYDVRLRAYVEALRTDPDTAARVEALKKELLEHPAVRTWSGSLWSNTKSAVLTAAADPDSELRARVTELVGVAHDRMVIP